MSKLHLGAVAPNEGARLLAQWAVAQGVNVALTTLWRTARISRSLVGRLLTGEVLPGEDLAVRIAQITGGRIDRRTWRRQACGWWFDADRAAQRVAA